MKLTFLGTSCGVPVKGRHQASMMLDAGGRTYIIDAGAPVAELVAFHGKTPAELSAVFITHNHGDHVDGLLGLCDIMSWYYRDADPVIFLPEISFVKPLEAMLAVYAGGKPRRAFRFSSVRGGEIYKDGTVTVTAHRTKHCEPRPSYAYLFTVNEEDKVKRILFTGDLNRSLEDYPSVATETHIDVVVCEGAHFDPRRRAEILARTDTDLFILNHLSLRYMDGGEGMVKEFTEMMPFKVIEAFDGEVYEI